MYRLVCVKTLNVSAAALFFVCECDACAAKLQDSSKRQQQSVKLWENQRHPSSGQPAILSSLPLSQNNKCKMLKLSVNMNFLKIIRGRLAQSIILNMLHHHRSISDLNNDKK